MQMGSQDYVERLTEAGRTILECGLQLVGDAPVEHGTPEKIRRDESLGREMGMALFLACVGDGSVNRIALIQGFAHAVGECVAQQPPLNGNAIVQAMGQGLSDGIALGRASFPRAGAS